ncbi:MAG: S8 family serine peptidase [Bacteroidota bacterium]
MMKFPILTLLLLAVLGMPLAAGAQIPPNDPLYPLQWGYNNIGQVPVYNDTARKVGCNDCDADVLEAWGITTGSPNVTIAIFDGGADFTHPDFSTSRLWTNTGEIPGNGVDDDLNGYIDDRHGYDFAANNGDPSVNPLAHGVAMVSLVGATPNNGEGLAGVDWNARLMIVRVVKGNGNVDQGVFADAIRYAVDNGADIITASFGFRLGFPQPGCNNSNNPDCEFTNAEFIAVEQALDYARANNVAIFAATGNDDSTIPEYPAAYPQVMALGAASPCLTRKLGSNSGGPSCEEDTRSEFSTSIWGSNYGPHVDLLAPGTQLPAADAPGAPGYSGSSFFIATPDGNYVENFYGTSDAAPFAAGVAGLMLAANPNLTDDDIYEILRCTATDVGLIGVDDESGHGLINAHRAVLTAQTWGSGTPADVTLANQSIGVSQTLAATNTITVGPNVDVTAAVNLDLTAGSSILFRSDFTMVSGATLEARIGGGNGCRSRKQSASAAETAELSVQERATLESYPNPFWGTTTLRVASPVRQSVQLRIMDVRGGLVARLWDGPIAAGVTEIAWQAERLPAGIYLARLELADGTYRSLRLVRQE